MTTTVKAKKQVKVKGFKPSENGFSFPNRFPGFPLPEALKGLIDMSKTVHGLCGGMCFTVIDYARANQKPPKLKIVPKEDTPLYDYLKHRQLATWGKMQLQALRYVQWMMYSDEKAAAETVDSWKEIRHQLNRGDFAVMGLIYHDFRDTLRVWDNHQVLAYGYSELDEGRFRIDVYDPNYPNNDTIYIECEPIKVVLGDEQVDALKCVQIKDGKKLYDLHGFIYVEYHADTPPIKAIEDQVKSAIRE